MVRSNYKRRAKPKGEKNMKQRKNMTTLRNNQIIKIKTQRNAFGKYEGFARITTDKVLDEIWYYNGFIGVVELLEPDNLLQPHNLEDNYMPIEPDDIIQVL